MCDNMDEPGGEYAKWNRSEKDLCVDVEKAKFIEAESKSSGDLMYNMMAIINTILYTWNLLRE